MPACPKDAALTTGGVSDHRWSGHVFEQFFPAHPHFHPHQLKPNPLGRFVIAIWVDTYT